MNNKIEQLNEQLKINYSGISASSLNWYDLSPLNFKKRLDKEIKDDPTKETELGNQVHTYILEPKEFSDRYLYLSFEKPKSQNQKDFCESCANMKRMNLNLKIIEVAMPSYKSIYNTDKKSEEKIKEEAVDLYRRLEPYIKYLIEKDKYEGIISGATLSYLKDVRRCIIKHDMASNLIYDEIDEMFHNPNTFSSNELKVYWEHPTLKLNDKPLVLKSILDRLYIDHKNKIVRLVDLKTSKEIYKFGEKFKDYNYKRQMAFYWYAIEYLFKKIFTDKDINKYTKETYIVGIQTPNVYIKLPTECIVANVENTTIQDGVKEVDNKLSDIIWHFENDEWSHNINFYLNNGIDLVV